MEHQRIYIEDFCYDLNYQGVILYIGNVDSNRLREALVKSMVNKIYRLDFALEFDDLAKKNFIYVENCDLQELCYPVYEYLKDGYDVYVLHEDSAGKFYVKPKL